MLKDSDLSIWDFEDFIKENESKLNFELINYGVSEDSNDTLSLKTE